MKQVFLLILLISGCAKQPPVLSLLPDFVLTDQNGSPVKKKDLLREAWVANFIFTRCADICPLLTQKMMALNGELLKKGVRNFQLVSLSVDPENDTPQALEAYRSSLSTKNENWILLTGPTESIQKTVVNGFRMTMGKLPDNTDNFGILHGDKFVLVDREGRIRGYYSPGDMRKLTRDIVTLERVKH
ncbi:MAG: SCO family protein [Deltaproteobacteria bacterium]|nr:SCO family protein [Deltaproteobacteria bacterium]